MSDETNSGAPWWHGFFDETYAEFGLTDADPEIIARTVEFLRRVLHLHEGMHVFDQCCGVGRLSVPLARGGMRVTGVDQTAGYIEQARRDARAQDLPAEFHCADAFEFVTEQPCDAAINWFTSFGYDECDEVNARMLRCAFDSVRPGGRIVVDYLNLPKVFRRFQSRSWHGDDPASTEKVIVAERPVPDFVRGMIDSVWTFIHPDGRREQRDISIRMYLPHEIVGLLRRCGFDDVELIAVARKP
jgi:SAM-dependent methyltransferase